MTRLATTGDHGDRGSEFEFPWQRVALSHSPLSLNFTRDSRARVVLCRARLLPVICKVAESITCKAQPGVLRHAN